MCLMSFHTMPNFVFEFSMYVFYLALNYQWGDFNNWMLLILSFLLCHSMLNSLKQKKAPAEPTTVQTPDSANLKVNQVFGFSIEMKCIFSSLMNWSSFICHCLVSKRTYLYPKYVWYIYCSVLLSWNSRCLWFGRILNHIPPALHF